MNRALLCAPAKLNLHLGIYSELDERRYHKADSLMVALDLADEVLVEELPPAADAAVPQVVCDPPLDIPAHKNTVYRAAAELAQRVGRRPSVRISIRKHIPDQSGMGGSSSDAAATLLALCKLWGQDPEANLVVEAARCVGADVPFFLDPVPTLLTGAGDVVEQKFSPLPQPIPVVLMRPSGPGVSTPEAYRAFDEQPTEPTDPARLCKLLRSGRASAQQIAGSLANNLDPVACRLLPKVREVRSWLLAQPGVLGGQVTGSGSCVFAICDSDNDAQALAERARTSSDSWVRVAHIV